jgi:hypothetical protein
VTSTGECPSASEAALLSNWVEKRYTAVVHWEECMEVPRTVFSVFVLAVLAVAAGFGETAKGPLRVHATNPRYFTDDGVRAVYLTGSHTWANFQDVGPEDRPEFPYQEYLDFLQEHHHNFVRLWVWEQAARASWTKDLIFFSPLPYLRVGPGAALDGKPKFDLDRWNEEYFQRLRDRVEAAGQRGVYVSVMLFQGWSLNKTGLPEGDPWPSHPFNPFNNVNQVGKTVAVANEDRDDQPTLHSLRNPDVLARQDAYVRKVVDTLNDLDNVLFEVLNEGGATDWQYHVIDLVHQYEKTKPKQHPVGMTSRVSPNQPNRLLFASPADWISPAGEPQEWLHPGSASLEDYKENPPTADGRKVVVTDTDHLWGHGGNHRWVWKSFTRGLNPVFMDPWWSLGGRLDPEKASWMFIGGGISKDTRDYPDWEPVRQNLGYTLRYAEKMNLAAMSPRPKLSSAGYCLAERGAEYLFYFPESGSATINLSGPEVDYSVEWFIPLLNRVVPGPHRLKGGDYRVVTPPFTGDAVLYLRK